MISTTLTVSFGLWAAGTFASGRNAADHLWEIRDGVRARGQLLQGKTAFRRGARCATGDSPFLNDKSQAFAVDGSSLPEVPFDVGESYAGLLPITANQSDPDQLFFWFFPTTNPNATKEITLWFQGGPGCSSLTALLQENGPFLWPPGVAVPYQNPFSWTNLTNMVWIDNPSGIGLSQGNTSVKDPIDAAHQFMGFWKNFNQVFNTSGYKIYLVGESYAGAWASYFADEMLAANDTENFNVAGVQLTDPYIGNLDLQTSIPSIPAAHKYNNIFFLNQTFLDAVTKKAQDCGILDFYNDYIDAYPPPGPLRPVPDVSQCDVLDDFWNALVYINPCTNPYHIIDVCPFLPSVIGYDTYAFSPEIYFNRSDVQAALHVPPTSFSECSRRPGLLYDDNTVEPSFGPLPRVIDKLNRTVISNGELDFALFTDGVKLAIQNMTWGGLQGFQQRPSDDPNLFVPYHPGLLEIFLATIFGDPSGVSIPFTQNAGAGLIGTTHTERGLTFVNVFPGGHQLPQYAPGAAYRILEFFLGRIESLEQQGDFTTQTGNYTGVSWI